MMPDKEELIDLRERGLTRDQIADHYKVTLSTVKRWIKLLGVPRPSKNATLKRAGNSGKNGEHMLKPDDGMTTLEQAIKILGPRFQERRNQGYFLDGRPANIYALFSAAGVTPKKI